MNVAAVALSLSISFALGYLLLRCWRTYWVDQVRHALFCARDELFLYASDNGLLDHPAHRNLRELTNTFIRYAHIVSFGRVAALTAINKFSPPQPARTDEYSKYREALKTLPEKHRERFEQTHMRITTDLFKYLYRSSLLLRLATIFAAPLFLVYGKAPPSQRQVDLVERDAIQQCAA